MRRAIAPLLLALLPAACLEVKDQAPPMCRVDSDCNTGAGEICDEGVCWGNPPAGMFAAVVSPPSERPDLVSREVLMLPIADNGWMDDIHLDTAVALKGRLQAVCGTACDGRTLSATMTVTRPSIFNGGPGVREKVTVDDGTFDLLLPVTRDGDDPYTVTVVPGDRDTSGSGQSLAQLVPPLQVRIPVGKSITSSVLEVTAVGAPRIQGNVVHGVPGNYVGLAGYRVVALGRWAADQPMTEVSTVDFTSIDGYFSILLSRGLVGFVEIVARPTGSTLRPELHLGSVPADKDASGKLLALPSVSTGDEIPVSLLVDYKRDNGEIAPVGGARVMLTSSSGELSTTSARFSTEGITGDDGVVHLRLLDLLQLRSGYRLSIIPPPGSTASALFEKPYVWGATQQRLGTRIAITGTVLGADGQPMKDVSVTARPSVRFLWSLEPGPQEFLGAIPTATMVTKENGVFVLFVDHALSNTTGQATTVWGHYDLTFEPTLKARAPSWSQNDLELPRDDTQATAALGEVRLPDAAYVRGAVFDDANARVEGAEVRLFLVQTDEGVCQDTRFEPVSCPIPPLLMGRAASEKDGLARLILPRVPR